MASLHQRGAVSTLADWIAAQVDQDEDEIDVREHDSGQCDYLRGIHHEPERALAEVALKRDLLALAAIGCEGECWDHGAEYHIGQDVAGNLIRAAIAKVYSDRPGYAEAIR
jgi:Family of unknown function (DUF6221)